MKKYTEEQIEQWKNKAEKWDNLDQRISKCYIHEDESENEDSDLGTIGELAAIAFGYL